jgi:hypothetical protein
MDDSEQTFTLITGETFTLKGNQIIQTYLSPINATAQFNNFYATFRKMKQLK